MREVPNEKRSELKLPTGPGASLSLPSPVTAFFGSLQPASVTPRVRWGPAAADLGASASASFT